MKISRFLDYIWGDLSREEYKKFGTLSVTLLFIVGTYWLLRPIKDAFFATSVGSVYLPYAKVISTIFLIPIILLYSKLVDMFDKQQLFYVIAPFYGILFLCIAYLLANPTRNIADSVPCLGWAIYLGVESFVLLIISLFWSFVASVNDAVSAKKGYALIFAGAQVGTIIGPEFAKHATQIGISNLLYIAACGVFMIPIVILCFEKLRLGVVESNTQIKDQPTGFFEGLRLLISKPYLIGILGIATLGCIIATILEFELIYKAKETFHSTEKIAEFLGLYGQCANTLTLLLALFGTSLIVRKFGLTLSLVAYPAIVGLIVCVVWYSPTLWVLFASMVIIKCLSYALNGPCKEIAYIPTSKDVKFKAKGWIDTVGYRSAESMGGAIGIIFPIMTNLVFFGSLISIGVVAVWTMTAIYVGTKNSQLLKNNKVIE